MSRWFKPDEVENVGSAQPPRIERRGQQILRARSVQVDPASEKALGEERENLPPRARILRGNIEVLPPREVTSLVPDKERSATEINPEKVQRRSSGKGTLQLAYNARKFTPENVETFEEREKRYQDEVESLKQQLEDAKEEYYKKGLAEGEAKGAKTGEANVRELYEQKAQLVTSMAQSLAEQTALYYERIEEQLVEFSMAIAGRVVHAAAEQQRSVAVALAKEALSLATERTRVIVRCNEADLESLREVETDLLSVSEGIREITFEASRRVRPGGVILETDAGSIDATVETLLDEVQKSLLPNADSSRSNSGGDS